VISQLLLAVPLCLLYEVGIQLARLVGKRPESDPAASASGGG
jgi:Sec-independent protein secretion pathway component TatC